MTRTQAFGLVMLACGLMLANGLNALLDRWWAGTLTIGIAAVLLGVAQVVVGRRPWPNE